MSLSERATAADRDRIPQPMLVRPFEGGTAAGILMFLATAIEIISGAMFSRSSPVITIPLTVLPIVVMFGFAVVQWLQMRASRAEPVSWWHLTGVAIGLLVWFISPRVPQPLAVFHDAPAACRALPVPAVSDCVQRAAQAFDNHYIVWWSALGLIVVAALLTRRSRIAAWAAIPTGIAGCVLASNMLEQLLVHFNVSG